MKGVLQSFLGATCNVYDKDILVDWKDETFYAHHLTAVLIALREAKLKVNFENSEFFQAKIIFFGCNLNELTNSRKKESVECVRPMKKPDNVRALRIFLGLAGHFRNCIKHFAAWVKALNNFLLKNTDFI